LSSRLSFKSAIISTRAIIFLSFAVDLDEWSGFIYNLKRNNDKRYVSWSVADEKRQRDDKKSVEHMDKRSRVGQATKSLFSAQYIVFFSATTRDN
jgi:hypothetical protein